MTLFKLFRKEALRCIAVFTYVHAWVNKAIKVSLGSMLNPYRETLLENLASDAKATDLASLFAPKHFVSKNYA